MSRRKTPRPPQSAYITPEGFRALSEEMDHLWNVERPKVTEAVTVAAALGDRSENADYQYGKKRLREIDSRVEFLDKRLKALKVVDVTEQHTAEGKVFFGAWVRLEDDEGNQVIYRIVGPDEFDANAGMISMDSPVGKALIHKEEGDEVVVRRPRGDIEYTILEVRFKPFED
ncbi:MAG: transcription elongation factor GreB [Deltaproteobacteria bacterium]|nr:transcription elongation factor GreB [Deltaproteobacteria bacterium]